MNTLRILQDDMDCSPRDNDNLGIMVYKHRSYKLGDVAINDPIDWFQTALGYSVSRVKNIAKKLNANYYSEQVSQHLEAIFLKNTVHLPLYFYEHSGITISTTPYSCPWDSGKLGFIYTTDERIRDNYMVKKVTKALKIRALEHLEAEVEEFRKYLEGEVYRFEILDEEGEVLDTCGGFLGNNMVANGMADSINQEDFFPNLTNEKFITMITELEITSYEDAY